MKYLNRAIRDTFHNKLWAGLFSLFGVPIGLILLFLWKGEDVVVGELPSVIAGFAGSGAVLALLFMWNFFCSPFRIERDEHKITKATLEELGGKKREDLSAFVSKKSSFTVSEAACLLAMEPFKYTDLTGMAAAYKRIIDNKIIQKQIALVRPSQDAKMILAFASSGMAETRERFWKASDSFEISKDDFKNLAGELKLFVPGLD